MSRSIIIIGRRAVHSRTSGCPCRRQAPVSSLPRRRCRLSQEWIAEQTKPFQSLAEQRLLAYPSSAKKVLVR